MCVFVCVCIGVRPVRPFSCVYAQYVSSLTQPKKKASLGYHLQLQLHPASPVSLCGSFNVISRINFDIVILRFACFFSFAFTVFAFAIFYFSLRTFIALLACAFSSLFDFNNVASSQFLSSSANFASTTASNSATPLSLINLYPLFIPLSLFLSLLNLLASPFCRSSCLCSSHMKRDIVALNATWRFTTFWLPTKWKGLGQKERREGEKME